jgi:hypothetical protein
VAIGFAYFENTLSNLYVPELEPDVRLQGKVSIKIDFLSSCTSGIPSFSELSVPERVVLYSWVLHNWVRHNWFRHN